MSKLTDTDKKIWKKVAKTVTPLGEPMPSMPGLEPMGSIPIGKSILKEKLKQPYQAVLDLHGDTQDEAYRALLTRLPAYKSMGYKTILVITGKGIDKEEGGVLKRLVPEWLGAAPFDGVVKSITPAKREHGGGGAFYINL